MLLPVSNQRAAVDLVTDPLLHHLPPMEFQARVHRVHSLGGQVLSRPPAWASVKCLGGWARPPRVWGKDQ